MSKKSLATLDGFIAYLEDTTDDEWRVGTVRDAENKTNCCFGHLINWWYGREYEGQIGEIWDAFEEMWATTYMIYPVNDGTDPRYPQATPRERVIAYLEDLNAGRQPTTRWLMSHYSEKAKALCH